MFQFGPLDRNACVVCVDMQRLFLEPGEWHCPAGLDILANCRELAAATGDQAYFIKYIPPRTPEHAFGQWREFHRRWSSVTLDEAGEEATGLHPAIDDLAEPQRVFDRLGFSAFASDGFAERIRGRTPSAMIVCGVETDVCVLSTILSAVDQGIRTIVPIDAVASASPSGHDAVLNHVLPRYDHQVELCTADEAIKALEAI